MDQPDTDVVERISPRARSWGRQRERLLPGRGRRSVHKLGQRRAQPAPQTHAHAALTSTSESRAWAEGRPAQSALVAPPQRIPGSARKASALGGFVTRLCLSSYELLTHSGDERGRVQTSTQPPPAQTQTHALFPFACSGRADVSERLVC